MIHSLRTTIRNRIHQQLRVALEQQQQQQSQSASEASHHVTSKEYLTLQSPNSILNTRYSVPLTILVHLKLDTPISYQYLSINQISPSPYSTALKSAHTHLQTQRTSGEYVFDVARYWNICISTGLIVTMFRPASGFQLQF